jgi:hypothetical protein
VDSKTRDSELQEVQKYSWVGVSYGEVGNAQRPIILVA